MELATSIVVAKACNGEDPAWLLPCCGLAQSAQRKRLPGGKDSKTSASLGTSLYLEPMYRRRG